MMKRWQALTDVPVYPHLVELARHPFDLTIPGVLTPARMQQYCCSAAGFDLLYATQRVSDETLAGLQKLADQCLLVEQFRQMRRGAVMNRIHGYPSEDRQVLHTACRDLFGETPAEPAASAQAGREIARLKVFLEELENGTLTNGQGLPFDTMIHVGIGGSDLGPRSVYEALRAYGRPGRQVYFISNVDPDDAAAVLRQVNLATTLVNVVSKSGTTLETLTNETLVRRAFEQQGLDPCRHCMAVTGTGSPMDNPARYLRSFYMFDYIGGRYSSTSMVGAVMLAFALGIEPVLEFLEGASLMDMAAEGEELQQNMPLLLAMLGVWNHSFLGASTVAVLPYSQALHRFAAHLQQCDMESNGKSVSRYGEQVTLKTGPILWGEPGTNGQHAFYQLLHQGTEIVPVEFIGFRHSQYGEDIEIEGSTSQQKLVANLLAQSLAMAMGQESENPNRRFPGNRPNVILLAERLTPKVMGALLALYEAKIVFQGFCWNINSFDQEGVQLGKVLAGRVLALMRGQREDGGGDSSPEMSLLKMAGIAKG
ncbi:MAG: glucose-6-phosphate isomerase [Desulfoarculaceae bacterium]|nr:glucose-6-phosphate isomerase [Desulfoarculaceae bacterium]